MALTFTNIALSYESPQHICTMVTISWFVKGLLGEIVTMSRITHIHSSRTLRAPHIGIRDNTVVCHLTDRLHLQSTYDKSIIPYCPAKMCDGQNRQNIAE